MRILRQLSQHLLQIYKFLHEKPPIFALIIQSIACKDVSTPSFHADSKLISKFKVKIMSVKSISNKKLFKTLTEMVYQNMGKCNTSVSDLAKAVALSPSQLNRRVKDATGMPVSTFVMRLRLEEAKKYLLDTEDTIHSVAKTAVHCGFADSSHFCHVFRRFFGISPYQFVRQHEEFSEYRPWEQFDLNS